MTQLGIAYDVVGVPHGQPLDPRDVGEVLRRYPQLNFSGGFHDTLEHEVDSEQPYPHAFHPCTRIANSRSPVEIPDMRTIQSGAPFEQ